MEFDKTAGVFLLTPDDVALLGHPEFGSTEPLTRAKEMYERAENRAAMNEQRGLEAPRPGIDRSSLRGEITSTNIRLAGIMGIAALHVPGLVSPAHDVETHLSEWRRQYGQENN